MTSAKKERRNYYLYYTIMFMVSMAGASLWFFANNKSFVWSVDGLTQHYNALAYYGEYLRKIVRELWDNKRLVIPLYNFSLGYGADIFTTLQYYIFGDPLNLLSVFVQPEHTEYLYAVLMFIRMYLAGIAFSIYARSRKKGNKEVLLGCMVYLFSEYALYFFCQQPFFINPMIFFPLLLLAVDRIYEGKKPYLYIVMITVSAVSNLYFFYMMGILMVLYAVFRYFDYHKKMNAKIICPLLGRFFLYSMLGICMAAAFILPFVNTILSSGRFQTENYIPILYGLKYYMRLFSGFIMMDSPGYHTLLGFPAIAFLSVSLLLLGKEKKLKSGFVLLSLFLIFPFFGHIFNGASYVTNRWVFVYAFLVAYIVTEVYPLFEEMDSRQKKGVWLFAILESAACLAGAVGKYLIHYDTKALVTVINLVILIVMTGFLCSDYIKKRIRIFPAVFCLTFIGILINAYDVPREEGNSEFVTEGEALESLKGTPTAALKMYQDENTIWRYGENGTGERKNSALQTGLNGTSFYWSLANPYVADFQRALYLNEPLEHSYKGADKRSIMEVLSGVKYYMVPTGKRGPESYKKLDTVSSDGKKYDIYDSGRTLPLVFPYSSAVTREDFDKLPVERRQQLLLEKAVIEEKNGIPAELFTEADGIYEETVPNTKFKCKKGCELKEDSLIVKKSGAEVKVTADCSLDGELYVVFENLEYENLPSESFFDGISKTDWQIKINVSQGKLKKNVVVQNKKGLGGYCNRHDFLCNLEYQKAGKKEIVLKFPYEGIYKFKDIRVVSQPTKVLEDSIKEWENRVQGSFYQEGNCMISDIELKANSVVCFGIPYDKGWKVTVDGEENKALLGNLAYLAVPLKKGSHQLVFEYTNPYLKLGMLVSLGGTAVFLIYIWLNEKRCKKIIGKFEKTC